MSGTPEPERVNQRFPEGAVLLLMGPAGCGKTTVGELLAGALGWRFLDADSFHSPENVKKMAAGIGLDDADRAPWLAALERMIKGSLAERQRVVLACSALKARYRRKLRVEPDRVPLVYLKADRALLEARLRGRAGHYARDSLVESQLAALEEPRGGLTVAAEQSPHEILRVILASLVEEHSVARMDGD